MGGNRGRWAESVGWRKPGQRTAQLLLVVIHWFVGPPHVWGIDPVTPPNFSIPEIGYYGCWVWYDLTANHQVLTAGSGNWVLSAEEYSHFISNLWRERIVSGTGLRSMMPRDDQAALGVGSDVATGLGIFGSRISVNRIERWNYNEAGGGWLGGPNGIWLTLFNGYTIVFLSNTSGNFGSTDTYRVIEEASLPALRYTFRILSVVHNPASGTTSITWASKPAQVYSIEHSTDLVSWTTLKANHPSSGTTTVYVDSTGAAIARRYFRVVDPTP